MKTKLRIAIWLVVLAVSLLLASQASSYLTYNQNYTLPSYYPACEAENIISKEFHSTSVNNSIDIVLVNASPLQNYIVSQSVLKVHGVENVTSEATIYIDYASAIGKVLNESGRLLNASAYAVYFFPYKFIDLFLKTNNESISLSMATKGIPSEVKFGNNIIYFNKFYDYFASNFSKAFLATHENLPLSYSIAFNNSIKAISPPGLVALKYMNRSNYNQSSLLTHAVSNMTGISISEVNLLMFKQVNGSCPLLYQDVHPPSSLISQYVAHNVSVVFVYTNYCASYSFPNGTYPAGIISNTVGSSVRHAFNGTFYITGSAPLIQELSSSEGARQSITFITVFLALLVIIGIYFRSIIAPLITLSLISLSVLMGFAVISIIGILEGGVNFEVVEPLIVIVMGIGADYSVFLLSRFREELAKGARPMEAMLTSVRTSGRAIMISGTAVTAVFSSLIFIPYITSWGLVIVPTIPITILIATTLLPIIYMKLGKKVFWPSKLSHSSNKFVEKVSRSSISHSSIILVSVLIISVIASLFVVSVPLNFNEASTSSLPNYPAVEGLKVIENAFGSSFLNPVEIVIHVNNNFNTSFLEHIASIEDNISKMNGVKEVFGPVPPNFNGTYNQAVRELMKENIGIDNRTALITVITNYHADSKQAFSLISKLQDEVSAVGGLVGGQTAIFMDLQSYLLPYYNTVIIALPIVLFLVLALFMRSIKIAAGVVFTIILTIVSALSIVYIAYGNDSSSGVTFFIPILVYILMMGLASDYSVFILSRIREEKRVSNAESIVAGISLSAGAVTALGVILSASFGVLITDPIPIISELGAAIALAALFDTFLVRLGVYPALLYKLMKKKINETRSV